MKRDSEIHKALGFDDVLLVPGETNVKPTEVSLKTRLTRKIELGIPLVSAGYDYVTESPMAIALAQLGGLGVIHGNMPLGKQVEEVRRVKRSEGNFVFNPITISPESSVAEALDLMTTYNISGLPVIEHPTQKIPGVTEPSQKVAGIITKRDIRFFEDYAKPVSELMTKNVITIQEGSFEKETAKRLLHEHRVEKLVMLDAEGRCTGLVTVKDIEKLERFSNATRDQYGRLRVGAAVRTGKDAFDRTAEMVDAGLDVVFVDLAHAHTRDAVGIISLIRQQRTSDVQIVAGNVVTVAAARSLIDAGADAIKVGVGTTSQSVREHISGVGMPQLTALLKVAEQCNYEGVPVIVGGGIEDSGMLAKAIAAGAESVVLDTLFAGTDEAPGKVIFSGKHAYKIINPEAKSQHRPNKISVASQDPYCFNDDPVDTSIPYRGAISHTVENLTTGLKAAMAYTGSKDIQTMIQNTELVRTK